MGIILFVILLVLLGLMIGWGFLIGTKNVIIRMVGVGISLLAAIGTVAIIKKLGYTSISPLLSSLLSGTEFGDSILEFLSSAEVLGDAIVSVGTAFAAPILFVASFVVFAVITWIVGWIVGLIIMLIGSDRERKKKRSAAVIIPCAVAQALLTVFVLITPVAAYGSFASEVIGRMSIDPKDNETTEAIVKTVNDFESTLTISAYRAVGGDALCEWLTSFEIGGEKSNLASEAGAIGRVVGDVVYLADHKITEYGEDEADVLRDLNASLSESVILPAIAGEVVYSATDAWLTEDGNFFGVPSPDFEELGAGIFSDMFVHLLEIFHDDARDHDALCADLETITNTVVILSEDGIFRMMGEDGNALIDKLSGGTTVRKLVAEFDANPRFKVLISDVTNIGMRAIGTALTIPENAEEIYSNFTGSIAEELAVLNSSDKTDEEKCTELTEKIKEAFAESEIEYELDEEVVKLYAEKIVEDFGSLGEITEEDIAEYFRAYSEADK